MADYRLYYLDGAGHIGLADWIEARSDEDAIREARKQRPNAHICEIWDTQRLVTRLNHEGEVHWVDRA